MTLLSQLWLQTESISENLTVILTRWFFSTHNISEMLEELEVSQN